MIDRLHGGYKDTSDSEQVAAICLAAILVILVIGGILEIIQAAARLFA